MKRKEVRPPAHHEPLLVRFLVGCWDCVSTRNPGRTRPDLDLPAGMVLDRRWMPITTNGSCVLLGVAMYGNGKFWSEVRLRQVR